MKFDFSLLLLLLLLLFEREKKRFKMLNLSDLRQRSMNDLDLGLS